MMGIFIDTNVFYNIVFKTRLTERAKSLLEKFEEEPFYTSQIVVSELLYIAVAKHYRDLGLVRGRWDPHRVLAERGYPENLVNSVLGLLEELEVQVLPEPQNYREMVEVAKTIAYHRATQ